MKHEEFIDSYKLLIYIVILVLVFNLIYTYATKFEKTITIKNIDNIKLSSKYLSNIITDTEGNIYTVKNNIYLLFFTAPELYESLEENKKYVIKGYGMRIPLLGMYKHIYEAKLA